MDADHQRRIAELDADIATVSGKPAPENPAGIHPTEFNVLVKMEKVEERTPGGIIKPPSARDLEQARAMKGALVEVSPLAFGYEVWPKGSQKPAPGDRVAITKHGGVTIEGSDGEEYRLVKDKDVLAILDTPDGH